MTPTHVDALWRRAREIAHARGGITLHVFADLVEREVRDAAIAEAIRLCDSDALYWRRGARCAEALRIVAARDVAR